jgi:hypothetical protein
MHLRALSAPPHHPRPIYSDSRSALVFATIGRRRERARVRAKMLDHDVGTVGIVCASVHMYMRLGSRALPSYNVTTFTCELAMAVHTLALT